MAKKVLSDQEILAQIPAARRRAKVESERDPVAVAAHFDHQTRRIEVELSNGCQFSFPAELGQGLRGAADTDLAQVEVAPGGIGLHWERLDTDLLVSSLLQGIFGTRRWMQEMGRAGGQVRSTAKSRGQPARMGEREAGRERYVLPQVCPREGLARLAGPRFRTCSRLELGFHLRRGVVPLPPPRSLSTCWVNHCIFLHQSARYAYYPCTADASRVQGTADGGAAKGNHRHVGT